MSNGSSNDSGRNANDPGEAGLRIAQAQSVNPFDTLKNGPFGDLYGGGQSNQPVATPTFEQLGNPFHMRSGTNPLPINPNAPVYGDEFLKRAIVKPVQDSFGMLVSVTGTPQQWKEAASQLRDALSGKPLTAEQLGRAQDSYITREKVDASQAAIIGTGKAVAHIFADFAKDPQSEWNKRADIIAKEDPALGRTLRKIGDGKPLNAKDYEILAGEVAGQFLPDMIVDGAVRVGGKRVPPRGHDVDVDTPSPGGKRPSSGDGQTINYRPDPNNPGAYVPDFPETPRTRLPAAEQANLMTRALGVDGPLSGHVSREITQWSARTGGKIEHLYASPGVLYGNTRESAGLLGEAVMDAAKIPAGQRKAAHVVLAGVRDNMQDRSGRALADMYETMLPGKSNHAEFKQRVASYDKALDAAAAAELRQTPKGRQTLPVQEQAALLVKEYQVEGKLAPYLKREIVDWAQGRPKNAIENLAASGTELFGDGTVTAQRKRMNGVAGEALADLVSTPANRKAVDSVLSDIRAEAADSGLKGRDLMAMFEDIATPGTQNRKTFDKRVSERQVELEQLRRETPEGRQTLPAKEQAALLTKEYGVEGKLAPYLQREIVDWAQGRPKNAIENLGSSGTELFGDGTVTAQRKRMNGVAGEALADAVSTPANRKAVDSVINDIRYESATAGEKGPALMAKFEAIATPGSEARLAFDKRVAERQLELDTPRAQTPEIRQNLPVKQQAEQLLSDFGVKGRLAENLQVEIEIWAHGKPKNAVEGLRSNSAEMFGDGSGKYPAGLMGQALIGAVAQPGNRDAVASVVRDLRLEAGQHNTGSSALAEQFGKIATQGTPERQNFDARVATRQTELEAAARTPPPTTETPPSRPDPAQQTPPPREQRQLPPASDVADPLLPFHQVGRAKRAEIPDPILHDGKAYEIGGITADGQLRLRPEGEVVRNIPSEAMFVNGARKPDGSFEQVGREVTYRGETWRFDALASPGWQPGVTERGFGLVDPKNPERKVFVPADEAGDVTMRFAGDHAYRLGDVRHGVIRLQPADPGAELLYRPKPGDSFEARLNGRELEGVKTITVGQDGQLSATGTLRNGTEATQKVQVGDLAPRWRDVDSPDFKDKFQVDSFTHREAAERSRALATEPTGLPLRDPNFGTQPETVRPKLSLGAGSLDDQADFIRAQSAKIPPGGDARLTVYNIAFNNQGEAQRVLDAMGDFRERHPNAKIEVVAYKPSFDSFQGNQAEFAKLNQFIKDNGVDLKFMEGTTSRQVIHAKGVAVNDEVLFTTGAVIDGSKHKADISTPLSREGGAAFRRYFDEAVLGDAGNVRRQALAADLASHGVLINDPVARLPYIARAQDGLIRGADKELFIGVSELRNPDTARDIVQQLGDKPGLKVEIQYREMDPQSQALLQQAQKDFPGRLQVQDVSKWEPRPHFNTIIADGQQAYIGTAYLWPNQQQMIHHGRSFENGVLLQGESVRQLQGQIESLRQLQPANPGQRLLNPAPEGGPDVSFSTQGWGTQIPAISIVAPEGATIGLNLKRDPSDQVQVNGSFVLVNEQLNLQQTPQRIAPPDVDRFTLGPQPGDGPATVQVNGSVVLVNGEVTYPDGRRLPDALSGANPPGAGQNTLLQSTPAEIGIVLHNPVPARDTAVDIDLRNAQFGGGLINANTVNVGVIGPSPDAPSNVLFDVPEQYQQRSAPGGTRGVDLNPEQTIAPQSQSQSQSPSPSPSPSRRSLEPEADNGDRIVAQTADQRNLLQRTWDRVLDTPLPAIANLSVYAQQSGPDAKWQASLPVPAGNAIHKLQEYMANNIRGDAQASVDDFMRPAGAATNKLQEYMANNARGDSQASVDDFLRLVDPRRVADVKHSPPSTLAGGVDFVTGIQRVQSLKIEIDGANVEGGALRWDAKASAYQLNVTPDAGGYVLNAPLKVTPGEAVTPLSVSGARLTGPAANATDFPSVSVKMSDEYGAITLPAGTRLSAENVGLMNGVLANPEYRSRAGETQYGSSAKANYVVSEPRGDADARDNVFNRVFAGEYGALEAPKQKLEVNVSPALLGIHVSNPPMHGTRVGFEVERVQGPTIRELMEGLREGIAPRDQTPPANDHRQSSLPAPPQPGDSTFAAYQQSTKAVEQLNASLNLPRSEATERLVVAAATVAVQQNLRVDEVALNPPTATLAGGTTAFVIEKSANGVNDRYGTVSMDQAMKTPLDQAYARLSETGLQAQPGAALSPQQTLMEEEQRSAARRMA